MSRVPAHRRLAWMDIAVGIVLGAALTLVVLGIIGEVWI